jgi:hypothetical protein
VKNKNRVTTNITVRAKMDGDKVIREIRKIRAEIYEEVTGLLLEEKLERINQGGMEFKSL